MNQLPGELELERCYRAFNEGHDLLRSELQTTLAAKQPSRLAAGPRSNRGARLLRPGVGIAACLAIAVMAWLLSPLSVPEAAYGLQDLPKRLLEVRSVYVRGTNYFPRPPDMTAQGPATPLELYFERPARYRNSFADNPAAGVRQWHIASDGQRHVAINDLDKTFVEGKEVPLGAEYTVEDMIQNSLVQQLLGGATASGFRKVRSEQLAGTPTDVYERTFQYPDRPNRSRIVVWLDPANGFPVQVQHFGRWADNPERLVSHYDKIEINGEPPAGTFDFSPPPGYTVEHRDVTPDSIGSTMSGSVKNEETGEQAFHVLRFCFNIDNRAALICWARFNDLGKPRERDLDGPLGRRLELAPTSSLGDRDYSNYFLRVDPGRDFHWRWALVVPEGEHRTLSEGRLVFSIVEVDGILTRGTMFGTPLRLDRERLARWIVDAQRLTLPPGAPADAIFTLERIETLIEQLGRAND